MNFTDAMGARRRRPPSARRGRRSDAVRRRGRELYDDGLELAGRRAGRAWSWPPSKGAAASRPGRTSAARWKRPGPWSRTAGPSPSAATWPLLPVPACRAWRPPARRRTALKHIRKDRPADALPAAQLARALDRDRVYLLSRLDPAMVEELEMMPIADGDELVRLARRHRLVHCPGQRPPRRGDGEGRRR